jgi:hypothetical protein
MTRGAPGGQLKGFLVFFPVQNRPNFRALS